MNLFVYPTERDTIQEKRQFIEIASNLCEMLLFYSDRLDLDPMTLISKYDDLSPCKNVDPTEVIQNLLIFTDGSNKGNEWCRPETGLFVVPALLLSKCKIVDRFSPLHAKSLDSSEQGYLQK